MRRNLRLTAVPLLIVGMLGATPIAAVAQTAGTGSSTVEISLTSSGPAPAYTVAAPGQSIVWTNATADPAQVTSDNGLLDSGAVPADGAYAASVERHGPYTYTTGTGTGSLVVGHATLPGADTELAAAHVPEMTFADPPADDLALHPDLLVPTSTSRVITGFTEGATVAQANDAIASSGGTIVGGLPNLDTVLLHVHPDASFTAVDAAIDTLRSHPAISYAIHDIPDETNTVPPTSSATLRGTGYEWEPPTWAAAGDLGQGSNWHLEASGFPAAWNLRETIERAGVPAVRTVVADTKFAPSHPDLPNLELVELCQDHAQLWGEAGCTDSDEDRTHGTHVAGLIGADHDIPNVEPDDIGAGTAGANPFADMVGVAVIGAPLHAFEEFDLIMSAIEDGGLGDVRVLNYSAGVGMPESHDWVAAAAPRGPVCGPGSYDDGPDGGTVDANGNPGRWCTPEVDDDHRQEVRGNVVAMEKITRRASAHGLMIVTSSGNASEKYCVPANQPGNCTFEVQTSEWNSAFNWLNTHWDENPDRAALPNPILTVGAVGTDGSSGGNAGPSRARMGFSNTGEDVTAPGIMFSTFPLADGGYGFQGGTSQAAPMVTGLVGYLLAYDPTLTLDELRDVIVTWAHDDTTGGAQPRISAFRSMLSLDGAARALVDVNDPSADGNRRVILGPGNTPAGTDTVMSQTAGAMTDADGSIDMRDFRRFRDAWLARCVLSNETGCPTAPITLDGPPEHVKFDANLDGCVSTTTATDPTCPTSEVAFPRFDFNGDGELSRGATASVPLQPDGTPAPGPAQATDMTDLQVLRSQWDTDRWTESDLVDLMVSGDLHLHADALLADGADQVDVTATRTDGTAVAQVTLDAAQPTTVLTVPDGDVVIDATATHPDGTTVTAPATTRTVLPGSDERLDLCATGDVTVAPADAGLDADGADTTTLTATVTSCNGDPIGNADVDFTISPSGPGHATVSPATATTAAATGQATATMTAGTEATRYTVTAEATLPDSSTRTASTRVTTGGLNVAYVWQMVPDSYNETGTTQWPSPIDPAQPDCTIPDVVDHCIDTYTQTLDTGSSGGYQRTGTLTGGPDRFDVTETITGDGATTTTSWTQTDPDGTDPHDGTSTSTVDVAADERDRYQGHDLGTGTTADEVDGAVILRGLDAVGTLAYHHSQTSDTTSYDPPADPRFPTLLPPEPVEIRSSSSGLFLDPANPDRSFRYADQPGAPVVFAADGPDAFQPVSSCTTLTTSQPMERGYLDPESVDWTDSGTSHSRDTTYDAGDLPMPVGTSDLTVTYAFTAVAYRGGDTPTLTLPDCATLAAPTATFDATLADPGASTTVNFDDTSTDSDGSIVARLWEFGDGTTATGPSPTHDYASAGDYDVRLTVRDNDGATATTTQTITVLPEVTFTAEPDAPAEGRVVTFTDTTGLGDSVDRSWDFGDSATTDGGTTTTHLYGDNGTFTVTLTLTTGDGTVVSSDQTLDVTNVAPTGDLDDHTIAEGQPTSVSVRLYDPGNADQQALDWTLSSTDATFGADITGTGGTGGIDHATLPALPIGSYPLTLTVTDKDAGTSTSTATLTVVAEGDVPPDPPTSVPPLATCDPDVELDGVEHEQLQLVNDYRADNGLDPVTASPALTTAAQRHADDMAANTFTSHTGSDGSTPRQRADDAGYPHGIGENAAHIPSSGSAADVMAGWRSSWSHNANILDPDWTVLGGARVEGVDGWYWVNVFGDTDDCDASGEGTVTGAAAGDIAPAPAPATIQSAAAAPTAGTTTATADDIATAVVGVLVSDIAPDATTSVTVTNRSRDGDGSAVAAILDPGNGTTQAIGPDGILPVTAETAGTQTVTLTSDSGTTSAAVTLQVGDAPNNAPTADAGGHVDLGYGVQRGEGVAFDASASTDPDGDATIVAYDWDLDNDGAYDDTTGEAASVDWATIETTVCGGTCDEGVAHPVGLRVTDDRGASDTADTSLTVFGEPDFRMKLSPSSQPINPGESAEFLVRVDAINGFSDDVRLTVPTLPDGWSYDLIPSTVTPSDVARLVISAPDDADDGTFNISVSGTGGGITHTSDGTAELMFGLIPECVITISGTVTDAETGDPLAGTLIDRSHTTDSNGVYSFEHVAEHYLGSIRAELDDYWTEFESLGHSTVCGNDEQIDIEMLRKRTGAMHGRVTEGVKNAFGGIMSTGVPLEGARVSAGIAGSQLTGADGTYAYDNLELNSGNRDYGYSVSARDANDEYWRNDQRVIVSADEDTAAPDLPLLRKCAGVVGGGTVVDIDGNPVANTDVSYWLGSTTRPPTGTTVTDANGEFSFDVETTLRFNNTKRDIYFRAYPPDDWWYESKPGGGTEWIVDCGSRTPDIELTVTEVEEPPPYRYVTVDGTVTDATTGDPIPDATARLRVTYPEDWPPTSDMTSRTSGTRWLADDGKYSIELRAGRSDVEHVDRSVAVTVGAPGYHGHSVGGTATTGLPETIDVELSPILYGSVEGTIRDIATGDPIEDAHVFAGGSHYDAWTAADGTYRVDGIPIGEGETVRTLSVSAQKGSFGNYEYYRERRDDAVINAGAVTSDVDLDLLPPCDTATVRGVVVDANTLEPIEDARVYGWGSVYTDADGRFAFTEIELGYKNSAIDQTIRASADGYQTASKQITVSCGSEVILDFGKPSGGFGTIVGTVTDDTGAPLEQVTVTSSFGGHDETDTNGDYRLERAPLESDGSDRTWTVTALTDRGLTRRDADVTVTADTEVRQDFQFGVNAAPTADSQTVAADQDTAVQVTLTGDDTDGDTLTYTVTSQPDHGTLAGDAPDLTYTPEAGWSGTDTFTFTVDDGQATSAAATVTIDVEAANVAPTADSQTVAADQDTSVQVTLTGDDADGDTLTYTVTGQPAHGTLAGDAPDVTYTPEVGWSGTDTFTFTVDDGQDTSEAATVTIDVAATPEPEPEPEPEPGNSRPTADSQTSSTDQDTAVEITLFGADADGDTLTYTVATVPDHGTLSGDAPDLTYTPEAGWSGTDTFTFTVDDGQDTSEAATVTINVAADAAEPTPPRIAGPDRVDTSVELSSRTFDTADAALIARADLFPDALAGAGLAAEVGGPLLLTAADGLDSDVGDELERLGVSTVYLLGGTEALSPQVAADLDARSIPHERIGGADRYETAALIAQQIVSLGGGVDHAMVALGHRDDGRDAWPDALGAANVVTSARAPLLLVTPGTVPDVTADTLDSLLGPDGHVWIAGGVGAVGDGPQAQLTQAGFDTSRLAGGDRYATATALATEAAEHGVSFGTVTLVSGRVFADALAAGPAAAAAGHTLLLVDPDDLGRSAASAEFLRHHADTIGAVHVIGGTQAISDQVLQQAHAAAASSD